MAKKKKKDTRKSKKLALKTLDQIAVPTAVGTISGLDVFDLVWNLLSPTQKAAWKIACITKIGKKLIIIGLTVAIKAWLLAQGVPKSAPTKLITDFFTSSFSLICDARINPKGR